MDQGGENLWKHCKSNERGKDEMWEKAEGRLRWRENRVEKGFNLNVCNILTHKRIQKEFHHLDSHMYIRVELRSANQKRLSGGRQTLARQICKHGKRSGKSWVQIHSLKNYKPVMKKFPAHGQPQSILQTSLSWVGRAFSFLPTCDFSGRDYNWDVAKIPMFR